MGGLKDYPTFKDGGNINTPDKRRWSAEIPIGASGATGTILNAPAGFACAKSATGVYDCTGCPTFAAGKGRYTFGLKSAVPTVGNAAVEAYDGAAGTMSFFTLVGATATEPASGDVVWVFFEGEPL